jgi:hypothetical protein
VRVQILALGLLFSGGIVLAQTPRRNWDARRALDFVQDGVWSDPEYLAPLVKQAQKVTLREDGQSVTVPLKLTSAPQ